MSAASRADKYWLRDYLIPEWRALCAGSAIMAARACVLLALPWPLKFIIDNVIYQRKLAPSLLGLLPDPLTHRMALLDLLGIAMLGLGALDALLVFAGNWLFLDVGQRVVFRVRSDLFAHMQRLSLDFHRRQRSGEVMARLSGDVRQLQDFIAAIGIDLLPHGLTIIGMATVMLLIDWRYALIALSVAPVLFTLARVYADRLRQTLRLVRRQESTLTGLTQEILNGVQVVQAFARETHEDARFGQYAKNSLAASLRANIVQAQFGPMMNFTIAAATGAIAWYGAASVIRGTLTPGELLVFLAYLRGLAAPARQFAKTGRVFSRAAVALERIGDYRAEQPSIIDPPEAVAPATCVGRIEFSHVGFGYAPGQTILEDLSFTLEPGRTVALVGATGSGKSTTASLIPRFYDVTVGSIRLDGRPITALPVRWLRRQIGLVLQEPLLFQATIWENIAYGLEGAERSDAIAAARAIGVDDIIECLPGGFDAHVHERGLNLSGGQRQCVAIARAMLCRAPIVILDEPSSNLDAATEQRVMAALDRLAAQRSALVIAHRLMTVMNADLILVLHQGRIVERGTHMDLLELNGVYTRLWQASQDGSGAPKLRLVGP